MGEDDYEDGQDMMEIDFSNLNRGRRGRNNRFEKKPSDPEKWKKSLVFGGAVLCVAILIIVIIFLAIDKSQKGPASPVQARIKALEEKVVTFQAQEDALQQSIARLEGSFSSLNRDLHKLTQEVAHLKKRTAGLSGQAEKTGLLRTKATATTRRRSHVVRKGESLYKIAKKYGISLRELYRLNHLSSKSLIHPGQKLLLAPTGKK